MAKLIIPTLCALLFCSSCTCTFASQHSTYLGGDTLYTKTNFTQGYGNNLFSTAAAMQCNFFIGHYITTLLGFEIGYQPNVTKNRMAVLPANGSEFGVVNFTGLASNAYNTSKKLHGFNFNYVPQLQLYKTLSLIAVLGVNSASTTDVMILTTFDGDAATPQEQANYYVQFKQTKIIPRLGVRLQYLLTKWLGLRASYIWENTARLQPTATRQINPAQTLQAKLTNTSALGIGLLLVI